MNDWKGNTIKKGDIVKIYLYRPLYSGTEMSLFIVDKDGVPTEIAKTKLPDEYVWELRSTYKIIGGTVFEIKENNKPNKAIEVPLCCFDFISSTNKFYDAICIEGVSDSRDEFMINHLSC